MSSPSIGDIRSAWDLPSSSNGDSRVSTSSSLNSPFPLLTPLPAELCAPLVLTSRELGILLTLPQESSRSSVPVLLNRMYLSNYTLKPNSAPAVGSLLPASSSAPSARSSENVPLSMFLEFVNVEELLSGIETRTTFMIRRLPRYISVEQLQHLIASTGILNDALDLIYVPVFTGKAHANRGYAFLNFKSPAVGALFMSIIRNNTSTELAFHLCRCDIVYAHIQSRELMLANLSRMREAPWWPEPSLPPGLLLL